MPEVIRNRFRDPPSARDASYQDASRTRPGFGPDEDPLAELARIVGETVPVSTTSAQAQTVSRRPPAENREPATPPREYPRRDTSWRDPQARTTVRAGVTPQTMPGQLEDLEAELFSEIRSENLRNLPPAPDLAQLGLPDARMPHYQASSQAAVAPTTRQTPTGSYPSSGQVRANPGAPNLDEEVTLPMNAVLRATPPSARASEDHGMQQPPRFNPAPVRQSTPGAGHAVDYDAYGSSEADYDAREDYDPAGALGAAHHDYDEQDAAYYAAAEPRYAPPTAHGPAGNAGYPPIPSQYEEHYGHDGRFEDDDGSFAPQHQPQPVNRRPPPRRTSPIILGAVTVVGVLVLGVGSVFAYRAIASNGATGANAPLIRADTRPMKEIVAQQPLGAAGPNLDTARPDGQDKLVTQTEDPVDQIPGKPPVRVVGLGAQNPSLAPVQRVRSVIVRPDGTIVTPDDPGAKPSPVVQPVRTVTTSPVDVAVVPPVSVAPPAPVQVVPPVQPTQAAPSASLPPLGAVTHIDPVPVTPKPNPAPAVVAAPKPPVAQVVPPVKPAKPLPALVPHVQAPAPDTNGPLALGPSSAPVQPAPAATPPVRVATTTPASVPAPRAVPPIDAGTGDYMVQISSQRSDAEARHALQAAEQKYAALGAKGGDVQQADLGARGTYYRARLAGGSHDQALALCAQIKAQGGDCVVAKR